MGEGRGKWRGIMKARRGLIARRGGRKETMNETGEKGAEMASLCVGKGTKGREERVKRKVGRRKQNFTPPSLNSDCNCNTIF